MRTIILATALMALASVTYAQPNTGNKATMNKPSDATTSSAGTTSGQGENCGTPDQFKTCPPLPRHPLPYYPANKQ